MKILVYPIKLAIGGAQINAVDLAAGVRDLGHDVTVFSRPGPLVELVRTRGLHYIAAPRPGPLRPSLAVMRALRRVTVEEGIDVIHAWGPNPWLEAFYSAQLVAGVPLVASFMDMAYVDYLPKTGPLIVGTRQVLGEARRARRGRVEVIEPPIDTDENHPSLDGSGFRRGHDIGPTELLIVIVSRLALHLKLESLERIIDTVAALAREMPVRLAVVGDGPARHVLEARAEVVNQDLGREIVTLTGAMADPRPAYAAADVVVGMGSSILRGMAFERPSLVLGERGFWMLVGPETIDRFLSQGFYGIGDGGSSPESLCAELRELLEDEPRRRDLGRFSRDLVCERFSVRAACLSLERVYGDVANHPIPVGASLIDGVGTALRLLLDKTRRELRPVAARLRRGAGGALQTEAGQWPPPVLNGRDRP